MGRTENCRADNEITHGAWLKKHDPEYVWGWGSAAGKVRAMRRADLISRGALLGPGVKVLEVGCGTGLLTEYFAFSGTRIVAVDISPDLLAKARSRGLPKNRVRLLQMRFEDSVLEGPFNAVIGNSVLHHLNLRQALENIFGLLKPGGWLSFAEPNMMNPQIFIERHLRFLFPRISPCETAFVRGSLKSYLRDAGFINISIIPFDWLHPATPRPLIHFVQYLEKILEDLPVLRAFSGSVYIRAQHP